MAIKLNELITAFSTAVIDAHRIATEAQYRALMSYFNDDGSPKIKTLKIPKPTTGVGKPEAREYYTIDVPIITLTPPTTLAIKDLSVSMSVDIGELPAETKILAERSVKDPVQPEILVHVSTASTKQAGEVGVAQVTLRISTADSNEAIAKLLSHFQKVL
jgi:hypothetical protein